MIPRVMTPAMVRVSGELTTFSNVVGSGFGRRPPERGALGADRAPTFASSPVPASCASAAARLASSSRALSRSVALLRFLVVARPRSAFAMLCRMPLMLLFDGPQYRGG